MTKLPRLKMIIPQQNPITKKLICPIATIDGRVNKFLFDTHMSFMMDSLSLLQALSEKKKPSAFGHPNNRSSKKTFLMV